jgi:hypothetical protein
VIRRRNQVEKQPIMTLDIERTQSVEMAHRILPAPAAASLLRRSQTPRISAVLPGLNEEKNLPYVLPGLQVWRVLKTLFKEAFCSRGRAGRRETMRAVRGEFATATGEDGAAAQARPARA